MNFLAHAYLSFNQPEVLVGNMISDFVKGRKKLDYPQQVQNGIMLHRFIDTFTDDHPVTREAKKVFAPVAGLYAGAFMDVVYDHFLALDISQHSEESWLQFSQATYGTLQQHYDILPLKFANMLPYMKEQDWLYNYRFHWGIENSFAGLVRRAKYLSDSKPAFSIFEQEYEYLQSCYNRFFPFVKNHAHAQFKNF
jgi:acyl carrier protein phosphodiesterase